MSNSLRPPGLYSPWNSPSQNTGVGSLSLLQRIFPTQGSNPGLPHCRQILQQLRHKRIPRILEWVAYPFCSRSSRPKNQTGVSCIAGRFFINWAIREAQYLDTICIFLNASHYPYNCKLFSNIFKPHGNKTKSKRKNFMYLWRIRCVFLQLNHHLHGRCGAAEGRDTWASVIMLTQHLNLLISQVLLEQLLGPDCCAQCHKWLCKYKLLYKYVLGYIHT